MNQELQSYLQKRIAFRAKQLCAYDSTFPSPPVFNRSMFLSAKPSVVVVPNWRVELLENSFNCGRYDKALSFEDRVFLRNYYLRVRRDQRIEKALLRTLVTRNTSRRRGFRSPGVSYIEKDISSVHHKTDGA